MSRNVRQISTKTTAAFLFAFAGFALTAQGDVPAVLDRLPPSTAIVFAMQDMEKATSKFGKLFDSLGLPKPAGEEDPMFILGKMLETPGINKNGSAATAIIPGPDGKINMGGEGKELETTAIVIVPVSDYSAFVKAMGATTTEGVSTIKFDTNEGFAKDIGGGYAALAMSSGLLEKFEGKAGNKADHVKALGKNGQYVGDSSDILIIANIPALQEQLKDASQKLREQTEQMAAMAGEQGAGVRDNAKVGQMMMDNFTRDASVGVLGIKFGETGVSIDIASQFKEGTELSKFFSATGKAGALMSKIPNLPFYFAGSWDTSAPGIKQLVKNAAALSNSKEADPANIAGGFTANVENISGACFIMGASPAAMMGGGLFVNSVMYMQTSDSAALTKSIADATKKSDGVKSGPVTTKATYTPGGTEIAGTKVDTWSVQMEYDPNDPMSGQAQMMSSMLLGSGGMSGMTAPVEGGVLTVYSQNTPLMTSAMETAKTGKGSLAEDKLLKDVQSALPPDRTGEMYIGVKPLMDAFVGLAAMMGGAPEIKVPAQMSPIGIGYTGADGGVNLRIFLATDTIKGIAEVVKQADAAAGEEEDMGGDADEAGDAPRF